MAVCADRSFEVEFEVTRDEYPSYCQVSFSITDPTVLSRELKGLKSITDHYPKQLLTMDFAAQADYGGIRHPNIMDFLLSEPTP